MNLTKCKNRHYYDADKYSSCPHCAKDSNNDDVTVNMEQTGASVLSGNRAATWAGIQSVGNSVTLGTQSSYSPQVSSLVSLKQAVDNVSSSALPVEDDDDKTVRYIGGMLQTEPVVGWLVCTDGQIRGRAFELKNGKNFIGRSPKMDIVLEGDQNISRDRHAIVTFEPKERVFFAQPGESRELFYVNGQVVLLNVQLKQGDLLSIGQTELMFVPLCGPDFSWDDKKK